MVSLVVAHSRNRVIGRDGMLPWHLPSDLRRFRDLTVGEVVIMGRKTFESLPVAYRPLPERRNLVLSTQAGYAALGAEVFTDLSSAIAACDGHGFIIGGGTTYAQALPLASRVYATELEHAYDGDAYFPALAPSRWHCMSQSITRIENGHAFSFRLYERAN